MSKVKDKDVRDYHSLQYNQLNPLNPNIRMHILQINQEPLQLVIVSLILMNNEKLDANISDLTKCNYPNIFIVYKTIVIESKSCAAVNS